jgi:hypothetical protein
MYFTEVDNWVGNFFLFVLGMTEIIVTGWLFREKGLPEINRGGYWTVPAWFYKLFIQFITPVAMIFVLFFYIKDTAAQGYYKMIPDFVAGNDVLIPWVIAGRIVVFGVVAIGCVVTYLSIKRSYKEELEKNQVLVRL